MNYFIYVLLAISVFLIGFNSFQINLDAPLYGDSKVAIIAVLAAFCVLVLLLILLISRRIEKKHKGM